MVRLLTHSMLALLCSGVVALGLVSAPKSVLAQQPPVPVSIELSGWGWCVAYREIGSVVANLTGSRIARDNATEIEDLYLTGTLTFNLSGSTDNFALEMRGTKVRSLFFLKQVAGGSTPLIAEFEGSWLSETGYVACEGRVAVPAPNHVAKPYVFVLRTRGVSVQERSGGGWVANIEFMIQKLTGAFDTVANEISAQSTIIKTYLGDLLAKAAVLARELRGLGIPYLR